MVFADVLAFLLMTVVKEIPSLLNLSPLINEQVEDAKTFLRHPLTPDPPFSLV